MFFFKGPLLHRVWDLVVFLCPIYQYWFGSLAFFLCRGKYGRCVWVFLPLFVIISMLYFYFFWKVISCFSEALFNRDEDVRSWRWELPAVRGFYWKEEEVNSVRTVRQIVCCVCVTVCVSVCTICVLHTSHCRHSHVGRWVVSVSLWELNMSQTNIL